MVYVTIPKTDYDEFVRIANQKVAPILTLLVHDYKFGQEKNMMYEFFPNQTQLEIDGQIRDAVVQLESNYIRKFAELSYKIDKIEKRWWYKLFNYFN